MYSIIFYPAVRKERYSGLGLIGDKPWIPLGNILSSLLKIENNADIDYFLDKFKCYGNSLLNMVRYDSISGKAQKRLSKDFYSTVKEEKIQILHVLDLYKKSMKQYPISNRKFHPSKDLSSDDTFELLKDSVNYIRINNILTEHALGRLSKINISLSSGAQPKTKKISMITSEYNKYGDEHLSHSSNLEKYISIDFVYKFSTSDFLTLPWLELIEIIKSGALIKTCDTCKQFFFDAQRKSKKFCSECGPESLDSKVKTDIDKDRERKRKSALQYIRRNKLSNEQAAAELKERGFNEDYKPRKKGKKGA